LSLATFYYKSSLTLNNFSLFSIPTMSLFVFLTFFFISLVSSKPVKDKMYLLLVYYNLIFINNFFNLESLTRDPSLIDYMGLNNWLKIGKNFHSFMVTIWICWKHFYNMKRFYHVLVWKEKRFLINSSWYR